MLPQALSRSRSCTFRQSDCIEIALADRDYLLDSKNETYSNTHCGDIGTSPGALDNQWPGRIPVRARNVSTSPAQVEADTDLLVWKDTMLSEPFKAVAKGWSKGYLKGEAISELSSKAIIAASHLLLQFGFDFASLGIDYTNIPNDLALLESLLPQL